MDEFSLLRHKEPINQAEFDIETRRFRRDYGLIPLEERKELLRSELSDQERKLLEDAEKMSIDLEGQLAHLPEVERLNGLYQLAGKRNPTEDAGMGGGLEMIRPAFHTRYQHSELLSELVKVAAVKAGVLKPSESGEVVGIREFKLMVVAALLHDIGHPAFSHIGEEFVASRGMRNHETRTAELLKGDRIQKLFKDNGLSTAEVQECMKEKGPLGTIQSFCDTLSYLVLDSGMVKTPLYQDQGSKVVADIQGIDQNVLVVSNLQIWQELLDNRAIISRDVYYHPDNKRTQAALAQLLRLAVDKGCVTLEEIENGTDVELRAKLQSLVQKDPGAAIVGGRKESEPSLKRYKPLFGLALGFFDKKEWAHFECDDDGEVYRIAERFPPRSIEMSVIVKPYDYRRKKLFLKTTDGFEHKLSASGVELREDDKKFHLYIPVAKQVPAKKR